MFQGVESFVNVGGVGEEGAFGEFEDEAAGGELALVQGVADVGDEFVVVQLVGRDVDADAEVSGGGDGGAPLLGLSAASSRT